MTKNILLHLMLLLSIPVGAQTVLDSTFLYTSAPFPSCHAATIVETHTGDLVAAYFGGSWEGCRDVCIWMCRKEKRSSAWTAPEVIADGLQDDSTQHPCWNPVLFELPDRGVHPLILWYKTGLYIKDWVGYEKYSFDGGRTWGSPLRLYDNLGPIKNKPVFIKEKRLPYCKGRLVCPSSRENGNIWHTRFEYADFSRMSGFRWHSYAPDTHDSLRSIQPTILRHRDGTLQALCRTKEGTLSVTYSRDNGATWTPEVLTDIPNPNSGIDAVTLRDGRFAMVYNPVGLNPGSETGPRTPLVLALSADGLHWTTVLTLEDQPGEYSYPSIIQGRDKTLHIVYTYNRRLIKYVHVTLRQ